MNKTLLNRAKDSTQTAQVWRALFAFAVDYQSGQRSRGYRLQCLAGRKLKRLHIESLNMYPRWRRSRVYKTLVAQYSDKV